MKKIKHKTHKGVKKVLNIRQSGSITKGNAIGQHNTGKKPTKANRKKRKASELDHSDYKRIKNVL